MKDILPPPKRPDSPLWSETEYQRLKRRERNSDIAAMVAAVAAVIFTFIGLVAAIWKIGSVLAK